MDFEQFQTQVLEEMRNRFPDYDISIREVSKLQGESYIGMSIQPEGSNIAATMNLEELYGRTGNDLSMGEIMDMLEENIASVTRNMPQYDTRTFEDYEQMKDMLTLQIIPIAGNEERLAEIPHKNIEDMAVVYRIELESNDQGTSSILVNNNMLQLYDITAEQLHADALEAAVENHPASLRNMNDVMREMMGDMGSLMIPDEPSPMWVATVEGGQNGAGVLQYPDFLNQAAETLGGDFFVLPSSIHEVLFIPDDGSMELSNLEQIVREVNETQVAPADRLSDNVFHYDSEARIFENAHAFEEREALQEEAVLADEPYVMTMDREGYEQSDTITVLLVEPNEHPKVIETKTGLEDLQALVGGYIEVTYPYEDEVGLVMNEEGKLNGLPLNRAIRDEDGEVQDIIAGSFLVVGLTEDSFGSLTDKQVGKFEEMFHQPEAFVKMGRSIMALPIPEETMAAREAAKAKAPDEIGGKPKHKVTDRDSH